MVVSYLNREMGMGSLSGIMVNIIMGNGRMGRNMAVGCGAQKKEILILESGFMGKYKVKEFILQPIVIFIFI